MAADSGVPADTLEAMIRAFGFRPSDSAFSALMTTTATAETGAHQMALAEEGGKLFAANCATCHGMDLQGTADGRLAPKATTDRAQLSAILHRYLTVEK